MGTVQASSLTTTHVDAASVFAAAEDGSVVNRLSRATNTIDATWIVESGVRGLAGTPTYLFVTTADGRLLRLTKNATP